MSTDPTRAYFRQGKEHHALNFKQFNDHAPPRNPIDVAHQEGRQHVNQATGIHLFHQNPMPLGDHKNIIMERVPAKALLGYHLHRHSLRKFPEWHPVLDYIERHLPEIQARNRA